MKATNADDKTVTDAPTRDDQRDIAQEHFHDAFYLGTDETGADHWWSIYHQAIVAFEANGNVLPIDFPEFKELPHWIDRIDEERGWANLQYTERADDQLAAAVDA